MNLQMAFSGWGGSGRSINCSQGGGRVDGLVPGKYKNVGGPSQS